MSGVTGRNILPASFEKIANLWLSESKNEVVNVVHVVVMWELWKTRNNICFNRYCWLGMQEIWRKLIYTLSQWQVLLSGDAKVRMVRWVEGLEVVAQSPPCLNWLDPG